MSTPETPPRSVAITNCHVHTFTYKHVPDRFVPWPAGFLLRRKVLRAPVLGFIRRWDKGRRTRVARYARVVEHSYNRDQGEIFRTARGYYPSGTRFVVLPMDMYPMKAGDVEEPIDTQHSQLLALLDNKEFKNVLIPFAAVDPRQPDVVNKTKALLANGFRGIKLYPPIGYHPYDERLHKLYDHAQARGVPVMTHCSHPAGVSYRGAVTPEMRENPTGGDPLPEDRKELLEAFTKPEAYLPILRDYPQLRLCLAHWGGAGDWKNYLEDQWGQGVGSGQMSWLATIRDLLKDGTHPNLFTDISYTVFADEAYVDMLKVLLNDNNVARSVLFGSDFYVVEDAKNEERRIAMRIRSVLGEDLFRQIAEENPKRYLGF